jgi:hypothetical protein
MTEDGLDQKASGCLLVSAFREEEIDGLAALIHRTKQISPLPLDPNIGLIQPPAAPDSALVAMERRFQLGAVLQDPAIDHGVVDGHPTFLHQFFHLAVA